MKTTLSAIKRHGLLLAALLLAPSLANAHVGAGETSGIAHGLMHPFGGLDPLCAMIAVGLWAAQMGGRSTWAIPLTFVSVMAFGGFLGTMGVGLPHVETGILLSVLTLGVFIAASVRLPLAASIAIVGLFAICHGFAHGAEMPVNASGLAYGAGFVIATAMLHAVGIGIGVGIQKASVPAFTRFAGAAIAVCGAYLWIA